MTHNGFVALLILFVSVCIDRSSAARSYVVYGTPNNQAWTWQEAEDYCQNTYGTPLGTVESDEDAQAVIDARNAAGYFGRQFWVGFVQVSADDVCSNYLSSYEYLPYNGNCVYTGGSSSNIVDILRPYSCAGHTRGAICDDPLAVTDPCDAVDCDDGNACTVDVCDSTTGECVNTAIECDDGDLCTVDTCDSVTGECVNTDVDCGDGDACTVDTCDSSTGECSNVAMDCGDSLVCVEGACQRDCSAFQIDEFLVDCSAEFEGQESDISSLQSAMTDATTRLDGLDADIVAINADIDTVTANVASNDDDIVAINSALTTNDGNIDTINGRLTVIETELNSLNGVDSDTSTMIATINSRLDTAETDIDSNEAAITAVNAQLATKDTEVASLDSRISSIESEVETMNAQLNKYTAHSPNEINRVMPNDEHDENENWNKKDTKWLSPDSKDTLIIALLVLNALTLVAGISVCVKYGNLAARHGGGDYAKVRNAYTSDDEQGQLQN